MSRSLNRHQFAYPAGVNSSEPRYGYWNLDDEATQAKVQALMHPAAVAGLQQAGRPVTREQAMRDLPAVEAMAAAERGEMSYDIGTGEGATPQVAAAQGWMDARAGERASRRERIAAVPDYQRKGQAGLRGYASNPLEEAGRNRITNQFWEAPLGGHVRSAAEGLGLEADHARMAEQGLAGLTAVGIGVPAFMAAVQQLSTPPDQNTIPL
jgi:hypothetical protein